MQIKLPNAVVDRVLAVVDDPTLRTAREQSPFRRAVEVNGLALPKPVLKELFKETEGQNSAYASSIAFLYSALRSKKDIAVKNFSEVELAFSSYFRKDMIKGYIFKQGEHKSVVPYLVSDISVDAASSYGGPHISLTLAYSTSNGSKSAITMRFSPNSIAVICEEANLKVDRVMTPATKNRDPFCIDFKCPDGILVDTLVQSMGYFRETPELHALYDKQIDRFFKFLPKFGTQFRVRGGAEYGNGYSLMFEGRPGRAILDTIPEFCVVADDTGKARSRRRIDADTEDEFSSVDELLIPLDEVSVHDFQELHTLVYAGERKEEAPLHPTLKIFHLDKQAYFYAHVNNLLPYVYKDDISRHLVLDDDVTQMTEMLVGVTSGSDVDDVIEGKSQNTLITCIGDPGVGKTLMAEVISEACKKPLYKVPADQLGGDAAELEENLKTILRRAEKWDCVLMIDEANAYVHSRGSDIKQNAIVGVFLRRIEYFKGILILTTNQTNTTGGFDIDDAVLSRSTVVFRIGLPSEEQSEKIWKIQAELQGVEDLSDALIQKLVKTYRISGRSIRQLLKLSSQWAKYKDEKLSFSHFKVAATKIPFTNSEKSKELSA